MTTITAVPATILGFDTVTLYQVDENYEPIENTDRYSMRCYVVGFGFKGAYISSRWCTGDVKSVITLRESVIHEAAKNDDTVVDGKLVFANKGNLIRSIFVPAVS